MVISDSKFAIRWYISYCGSGVDPDQFIVVQIVLHRRCTRLVKVSSDPPGPTRTVLYRNEKLR